MAVCCGCASRNTTSRREPPAVTGEESDHGARETANESVAGANSAGARSGRAPAPGKPVLPAYTEEGKASWYGIPFHGRRASNGEVYDMNKLTAAHRTLPFETMVRVTNLENGKSIVVRITDRGPFVDNRIIDLSFAAARAIDSVGPGVVPVKLEILTPGVDPTSGFFTVQVGAFRERGNAERLREKLSAAYSPIFIQQYDSPDGMFYRVRVGKVPGEESARQFSKQLRSKGGFHPMVVRLDENAASGGISER
jgi:peptidoglycan lytic transglycosylase